MFERNPKTADQLPTWVINFNVRLLVTMILQQDGRASSCVFFFSQICLPEERERTIEISSRIQHFKSTEIKLPRKYGRTHAQQGRTICS